MNVFVSGGSSPLGEVVVPRLARAHDVYALARSRAAEEKVALRGATPIHGALETPQEWSAFVRKADAIVHLAGVATAPMIVAVSDPHQPTTVISSASVSTPGHPRAHVLRAAEASLRNGKSEALVILRPTMIYGTSRDKNIRHLARLVRLLPAIPRLTGGGLIQPVLADDVADAIITTLGQGGGLSLDLGGPAAVRLGDVVAELARLIGRNVLPVPVSVRALAWLGTGVLRLRASPTVHALAMLRHDRVVTVPRREILGHDPTSLTDGLTVALTRYRDRP